MSWKNSDAAAVVRGQQVADLVDPCGHPHRSTKSGSHLWIATGSQLLFRFVAAAYERRSLAIPSHWLFEEWGRFLSEHSTAVSLDRLLHHNNVVATDGESYRMKEARTRSGGRPSKRH